MRATYRFLLLGLALLIGACASEAPPFVEPAQRTLAANEKPWPPGRILTLAYHEIADSDANQAFMTVRTANLVDQLAWLHEQGFQAISVDQLLAARAGRGSLPEKPLLLSFDDGYSSFYQRVLPILKAYDWPAIMAPVGVWLDTPDQQRVDFGAVNICDGAGHRFRFGRRRTCRQWRLRSGSGQLLALLIRQEMIGSAENPHKLDPSYIDIWKSVCGQLPNPANENLFEVAFGMGNNGDIGSLMGYNVASNTKYGSRGFGGSYVTSTAYYFYSFDKEDTRRDATLTWFNYTSDNKEAMSTNPLNVSFAKWRIYWTSSAFLALQKTATSRIATGINWILMRYSDVYLMYAEAMNALQGPDVANPLAGGMTGRQALEKVRERAFGAGSSKVKDYDADFFKAIVNERAWEFGCESIR